MNLLKKTTALGFAWVSILLSAWATVVYTQGAWKVTDWFLALPVVLLALAGAAGIVQTAPGSTRSTILWYSLLWLCLLMELGVLVILPNFISTTPTTARPGAALLALYGAWAGAIGGATVSLKGVYEHPRSALIRTADNGSPADGQPLQGEPWQDQWLAWHVGRPFSGAIAGGMTYLLLLFVSATSSSPTTPSPTVVVLAGFIVGTQERRFFNLLYEVAKVLLHSPSDSPQKAASPVIAEIRPKNGLAGSVVQIVGAGFGSTPGAVVFGPSVASVVSWEDTQVTVNVPSGLPTQRQINVSVVVAGGKGMATLTNAFQTS